MPYMVRIVRGTLRRYEMLDGVRRLGLAVSGGADSTALLRLMAPICAKDKIEPVVLHFEHGLRAESSVADMDFVVETCRRLGLECHTGRDRVRSGKGQSLEMAARRARFRFFFDMAEAHGLDAIATGHHADDVAETLVLRLLRGAGRGGLAGLRPKSELRLQGEKLLLVRPLFDCLGGQIRTWLAKKGFEWREDESNEDTDILRNAVRLKVIPEIDTLSGGKGVRQLVRTADILRVEDDYLDALGEEWLARHGGAGLGFGSFGSIGTVALLKEPLALQRRIMRSWFLRELKNAEAMGYDTITRVLERCHRETSFITILPGGRKLYKNTREISLGLDFSAPPPSMFVPMWGSFHWGGLEVRCEIGRGVLRDASGLGEYPTQASLSLAALQSKIRQHGCDFEIRTRRPGDRIAPLGMKGSRKIQDVLVDAKYPRDRRDYLPLFCCGPEVLWMPGYRIARDVALEEDGEDAVHIHLSLSGIEL